MYSLGGGCTIGWVWQGRWGGSQHLQDRYEAQSCCSDLGSPSNSLPPWTPTVAQDPQGEVAHALPPCCPSSFKVLYELSHPILTLWLVHPIGGIKPDSQVVPSCPQTSYIQQPLATGVPANILSCPSLLCSLPIPITPPTAGPDAKPTSSGLPGREGKGYLVLQRSSHSGRSAAV